MLLKKVWQKSLFGGPLEETFFSMSHILNDFSDQIEHSLAAKGFKQVLSGRMNNDTTEHLFSVNRHLCGNHLSLDVSAFAYNERTLFLRIISMIE